MTSKTPRSVERKQNLACTLVILAATLVTHGSAIFQGKVLLPADIVILMAPWAATAREKFPETRFAQNQLHGPIFEYYSWRYYARERIRAGEVPLWNPYELSGNVLLANSQSAVLYPPNVLLYILPLWLGINAVTAFHTFLTGVFMFYLLRMMVLRAPPSLTGALVWMLCGLQTVWTEFQTPTAVLCWLPALLLTWELFHQTGNWRWAALGSGGAIAMVLLAGHLHFAFYDLLAFALYALWRTLLPGFASKTRHGVAVPMAALIGAFAFGLTLSAATMLPVVEMARMNFRGSSDYAASIALRLPPENLLTLFQPNMLGNPRDYVSFDATGAPASGNSYWGKFDFIEYACYIGIPALILAVVGLFSLVRKRPDNGGSSDRSPPRSVAFYFALLVSIGLLLALGTPVCAVFYYLLPGYKQFNATARALCIFSFGAAALAAWGLQALTDSREAEQVAGTNAATTRSAALSFAFVSIGGLFAFPGMGLVFRRMLTDQWFSYELAGLRNFGMFVVLSALVIWLILRKPDARLIWAIPAIAAFDLSIWGWGFNPATDPAMLGYPTRATEFLSKAAPARAVSIETPGKGIKSFIVPNYNVVDHIREVQGADSLHTRRYHQFMEKVLHELDNSQNHFGDPNTLHFPSINHVVFDMLNVRYISSLTPIDRSRHPVIEQAEMMIAENPRAMGPAWLVSRTERAVTMESAFQRLSDPHFNPRQSATVEEDLGVSAAQNAAGSARLTEFSPHRLRYEADSPGGGLMVMSEPYFPGWQVKVDGKDERIVRVDYLLRGVTVGTGRHTIDIVYDPTSFRLGLFLSCIASAAAAWIAVANAAQFKPKNP